MFEYTEDIEDAENGSLEQAIEYCNSEEMGSWVGTEGAVEWIRSAIVQALNSSPQSDTDKSLLEKDDVDWLSCLVKMEVEYDAKEAKRGNDVKKDSSSVDEQGTDGDKELDLIMFSGMFRTGMDMLSDIGALA